MPFSPSQSDWTGLFHFSQTTFGFRETKLAACGAQKSAASCGRILPAREGGNLRAGLTRDLVRALLRAAQAGPEPIQQIRSLTQFPDDLNGGEGQSRTHSHDEGIVAPVQDLRGHRDPSDAENDPLRRKDEYCPFTRL